MKGANDPQVGNRILAWNPRQRVITTRNIKASVEELIKKTDSRINVLEELDADTQLQELVEQSTNR